MKLPANSGTIPARYLASCLALFAMACANPGPPRPPSLHLPHIVTDLTAARDGDQVRLRWTTPAKTTDELKVEGVMTAELCRTSAQGGPCVPVHRAKVQPGLSEVTDQLPPALRDDPQGLITYQVQLLNGQSHSAGFSSPVFVAAGAPPPMVTGLRVQATPQGALLQWNPRDAADSIELDRIHSPNPLAPHVSDKTANKAAKEPAELHLRAESSSPNAAPFRTDAGGTLDATVHRGETYVYTAQRVRKVVLSGHPLEIRGEPSQSISIVMRDSFPPRPPAGLETIAVVQNGGLIAVDLSWIPDSERDLAGYFVYRQQVDSSGVAIGSPEKMTPAPIQEPGFHDTTVLTGHSYSYSVTAIDESGNESAPGKAAREDLTFGK
jgi:hypothetical protein